MRAANAACLVELLISLESVIGERRSPMHWLAKVYDFIFGCRHDNLSRVFTIGGDTYIVCWLCGIKFPYSLDRMSIVSSEPEPPAQDFLTLGLTSDVALSTSRMRATVK
jgi:hypothetical protein